MNDPILWLLIFSFLFNVALLIVASFHFYRLGIQRGRDEVIKELGVPEGYTITGVSYLKIKDEKR